MYIETKEHFCKICKKWKNELDQEVGYLHNPSYEFYICEECLEKLIELLTHQHEDKGE